MPDGKNTKLTDKERIAKGHVLARIIIEVLGAPKEHVEEAVQIVVDKVHHIKDADVISENTYEAEEKGKLFVTFSELEIWFHNLDTLSNFLFEFTPSSVEIVQPQTLSLKANFVSGFLNDFLLKMHELGLKLKDTAASSMLLQKNADALIRNMFSMVLKEPTSLDELSKATGIPKDNASAILENFIKAKLVIEEDGRYVLVKKGK
ncbi:hypothetical protein KY363_01430 [Candidatus Woesearchaeota archaeon]|nr:hypothetical protein [Candidatus Woesearchaeota archaeon]